MASGETVASQQPSPAGFVWYAADSGVSTVTYPGLASSGAQTVAGKNFQLQSYTANNVLYGGTAYGDGRPGDTLTLVTPGSFTEISVLGGDFDAGNAGSMTINFGDATDSGAIAIDFPAWAAAASGPNDFDAGITNNGTTSAFDGTVGVVTYDLAANGFDGKTVESITFTFDAPGYAVFGLSGVAASADTTPPTLDTLTSVIPADDATGVTISSNLEATFSEAIALTGSGTMNIKNLSGGADIPVTLPGDVTVVGAVLTIIPASNLVGGEEYAVEISGDAIEDLSGNPYAGILSTDTPNWSFTADGTVLASQEFPAVPTTDTFETRSLAWTTAGGVEVGQAIRIQLLDANGGSALQQAAIDNIVFTAAGTGGGHDFNSYISDPAFGLDPGQQGFNQDPDGDRLPNGLEAWFGTHPGEFSAGLAGLATEGTTSTVTATASAALAMLFLPAGVIQN